MCNEDSLSILFQIWPFTELPTGRWPGPMNLAVVLPTQKRRKRKKERKINRTPTSDKVTLCCDGVRQSKIIIVMCEHSQKQELCKPHYDQTSSPNWNRDCCSFTNYGLNPALLPLLLEKNYWCAQSQNYQSLKAPKSENRPASLILLKII